MNEFEGLPGDRGEGKIEETEVPEEAEVTEETEDPDEMEEEDEKNRKDDEDRLLDELASQGIHKNLSFFAFTATPKGKTLQMFGQKDPSDTEGKRYRPFHVYSMRQAIEEHFILDVLQNYMTYKMYYKIAKTIADDPVFDTTAGAKAILNYNEIKDMKQKYIMIHSDLFHQLN